MKLKDWLRKKKLNERQVQVALLICEGITIDEVAARVFLTTSTVKYYLGSIYDKFNLTTGHKRSVLMCLCWKACPNYHQEIEDVEEIHQAAIPQSHDFLPKGL